MSDSYSASLRLVEIEVGTSEDTWGSKLNTAISLIDEAIAGRVAVAVAGNVTLTTNNNASDQARNAYIDFTGSAGGTLYVTFPDVEKLTYVKNDSTSSLVMQANASGGNVTVAAGSVALISTDGATNASALINITSASISALANSGSAFGVSQGGTGKATLTSHGVLIGNGAGCISASSAGTSGQALISGGASADPAFGTLAVGRPQGRLTLTTATPYMSADVAGGTTVYYTPAVGGYVPIYDGAKFVMTAFSELSQATTDSTKSPAACAATKVYDIFVWSDSGTLRATRGPAWSSDTSRGTGAGTSQLTMVNGIYTNTVAITNGPGAGLGTYVGTIRTDGSSQVNMVFGGSTGGAGGQTCWLGVWNAYNRAISVCNNFDNTNTWQYTLATYRLKNAGASATANENNFVVGLPGMYMEAINSAIVANNGTVNTAVMAVSIGLDSTSAFATGSHAVQAHNPAGGTTVSLVAHLAQAAPIGYHYVAPLEYSTASGTTTWQGDNGASIIQAMFTLKLEC